MRSTLTTIFSAHSLAGYYDRKHEFYAYAFLNLILIFSTYVLLSQIGVITIFPGQVNVNRYDAEWFSMIKDEGYIYFPDQKSNMAFFPLFAYIWKYTGLNALMISIFNLALFLASFKMLFSEGRYNPMYLMIIGSLPCFIFFFLPYSESLFFFFSCLIIIGYKKDSMILICAGIAGCCLTRSVSIFFIPAIVITEVLAYRTALEAKKQISNALAYVTTAVLATGLVVVLQGFQTGKWFYFIEVQKFWDREWGLPLIPFTTVSPGKVLGIDGIAAMLGVVAAILCCKWAWVLIRNRVQKAEGKESPVGRSVYFSCLFLSAIMITDTCFTFTIDGHTNIQCMNRHLLCTAFAVYLLNYLTHTYILNKAAIFTGAILILTGLYLTGVYKYPHLALYYLIFCSSILFYQRIANKLMLIPFYLTNLLFICIFYQDFLNGLWIG